MRIVVSVLSTLLILTSPAASFAGDVTPETDDEKTLYALGLALSRNISAFGLSTDDLEMVQGGIADGVLGSEPKVDITVWGPKLQEFAKARQAKAAEAEKAEAAVFLEKAAAEDGAMKTDSGLIYSEITAGDGPSPSATDKVKVHYHGTLRDGTVFDSSVDRGEPVTFPLNGVIKCWTEGVQKMKAGGKSKLVCPSGIAYGDRGSPPKILPGAALVFEVELLEVVAAPAPKAPKAGKKADKAAKADKASAE